MMKHYINKNKEIFGFELDGSQDHLITSDMVEISIEEIHTINQAKEDELKQTLEYKVQEAKTYLQATDFKMTVDYFGTLIKEEQEELIAKRAEAREIVRGVK